MSKSLIIKNADFSANSINHTYDLTNACINGFVSGTTDIRMYNSQYNSNNVNVPRTLILMTDASNFYPTNNKVVSWFLPIGMMARCFVLKTNYSIDQSTGIISNIKTDSVSGSDWTFQGNNDWINKELIYNILNVTETEYPIYGIFVGTTPLSNISL